MRLTSSPTRVRNAAFAETPEPVGHDAKRHVVHAAPLETHDQAHRAFWIGGAGRREHTPSRRAGGTCKHK